MLQFETRGRPKKRDTVAEGQNKNEPKKRKREQTFIPSYSKEFPCISRSQVSNLYARCNVCNWMFASLLFIFLILYRDHLSRAILNIEDRWRKNTDSSEKILTHCPNSTDGWNHGLAPLHTVQQCVGLRFRFPANSADARARKPSASAELKCGASIANSIWSSTLLSAKRDRCAVFTRFCTLNPLSHGTLLTGRTVDTLARTAKSGKSKHKSRMVFWHASQNERFSSPQSVFRKRGHTTLRRSPSISQPVLPTARPNFRTILPLLSLSVSSHSYFSLHFSLNFRSLSLLRFAVEELEAPHAVVLESVTVETSASSTLSESVSVSCCRFESKNENRLACRFAIFSGSVVGFRADCVIITKVWREDSAHTIVQSKQYDCSEQQGSIATLFKHCDSALLLWADEYYLWREGAIFSYSLAYVTVSCFGQLGEGGVSECVCVCVCAWGAVCKSIIRRIIYIYWII